MNLIERIEEALQRAGKSRTGLASAIGLSRQAFTKLGKSPLNSMKPENVARAARYLHADIYWLCTGEGGQYVPEASPQEFSALTLECAQRLERLDVETRGYAYVVLALICRGERPVLPSLPAPVETSARAGLPSDLMI